MNKKSKIKKHVLKIIDLNKIYDMGELKVHALNNINIDIRAGEFVSIMGPSGSGKSTLLNILGCLDTPSNGNYFLGNEDVSLMDDNQLSHIRNRKIGFVFQSFNLLPRLTVFENIKLPLTYRKENHFEERVKKAIEIVGLIKRIDYLPTKLSGGEMQRVAIARAIVTNPVILLADEPTGNLDSKTGKNIMEIFKDLNKSGVTILLITHEKFIAAYAKRMIKLKDGNIVSDTAK